jgi:hypothetical protein
MSVSVPDIPWQVAPATESIARARSDVPQFSFVKGWGLVLATPRVRASLSRELRSAPGPNRTVGECKRQIELAARQYAKAKVEAASVGEERRVDEGFYEGLVEMRVIYDFHLYYEIRQATLSCYSRPDGSIVDANVVPSISAEDGSPV